VRLLEPDDETIRPSVITLNHGSSRTADKQVKDFEAGLLAAGLPACYLDQPDSLLRNRVL
ncbi:MAG: hypothetical protein WA721_14695, partial [Candidatus Binataceae bacterium]